MEYPSTRANLRKVYTSQLRHALKTNNLHAYNFARGVCSIDTIDKCSEWIESIIKNAHIDGVLNSLKLPEA